jgi:hypothetical protein
MLTGSSFECTPRPSHRRRARAEPTCRLVFSSPAAIRKTVRHSQRSGERMASPLRSACVNASATASLGTSGSPANANTACHIRPR